MQLPLRIIPPVIQKQYNLVQKSHHDMVYLHIGKGIYGLKQTGLLAHNDLKEHLAPYGFIAS